VSPVVVRVLLLYSHPLMGEGLGRMLGAEPGLDVEAVDVSPANDWSEVRVWFAPIQGLGSTHWPVDGFIYNKTPITGAHGLGRNRWSTDPIGAIIAAFTGKND